MTKHSWPAGQSVGRLARCGLIAAAVLLAGGFAVAHRLQPDPRGYGTHQQFGLPGCGYRMLFGMPCPGCGMTTSFAHFARGELKASAMANPAGLLFATACAGLIPWLAASSAVGRLLWVHQPLTAAAILLTALGLAAFVVWFARMALL